MLKRALLGQTPLAHKRRSGADASKHIVPSDPDGEHSKAYGAIADKIAAAIDEQVGPVSEPKKKSLFPKISFK